MPKYAELVYNGFWFSPEREALQALVDKTQEFVTGTVRLKLYKVHNAAGRAVRQQRSAGRDGGAVLHRLCAALVGVMQLWGSPGCCGCLPVDQHALLVVRWCQMLVHFPDYVCYSQPPSHAAFAGCSSCCCTTSGRVSTGFTLLAACPPCHALLQGNTTVVGRKSPFSLYDPVIASFEDDKGLYNQADAGGFIKLQALRLRTLGVNRHKML